MQMLERIVQVLLDKGADPGARNRAGVSVLDAVRRKKKGGVSVSDGVVERLLVKMKVEGIGAGC